MLQLTIYYEYTYIKDNEYHIESRIEPIFCPIASAESHIFDLSWALETSHFHCYVVSIQMYMISSSK